MAETKNKGELPQLISESGMEIYHYPLNVTVGIDPHDSNIMSIRLEYNQAIFSEKELAHIIKEYVSMLKN